MIGVEEVVVTKLVADHIRARRAALGWSAQRLADECAEAGSATLSRSTIAKIEAGARKSVTAEEIVVLARVLGLTPNDLLGVDAGGRAPVPADSSGGAESRLHLVLMVEPDPIHPDLYTLSSWRQDDPGVWPPPAGDVKIIPAEELERSVDEIVVDAEREWAEKTEPVVLEFVLPRELLAAPVHLWRKEGDSGDPRPLYLDYPVVVRSLERMKSRQWHRVWRRRWQALEHDPAHANLTVVAPDASLDEVAAAADDPSDVALVLLSPPARQSEPGDLFTSALRSGFPVVLWHPHADEESLRRAIDELTGDGGLVNLPGRLRDARLATEKSQKNSSANLMRDLVVLWDDPERIIPLASGLPERE